MVEYRMMTRAHDRYNTFFRQTHKTFQIHHLALLMFKDYITILVGTYKESIDNILDMNQHWMIH